MKIGFFDSGLGGLLILKAVTRELPQYDYYYYGDTANLPYGDKTEELIYELTKTAIDWLFEADCALVIIACNTASSETLRRLQDEYLKQKFSDRRILGVIVPTVETLLAGGFKEAALIATKRTVESKKYEAELMKHQDDNKVSFSAIATPALVPLIEAGNQAVALVLVNKVLEAAGGEREAVILGCTHYSLLKDELRARWPATTFISQDEIIPQKIQDYLQRHPEIETRLSRQGKRQIHLTSHRPEYDLLLSQFLGGAYLKEED